MKKMYLPLFFISIYNFLYVLQLLIVAFAPRNTEILIIALLSLIVQFPILALVNVGGYGNWAYLRHIQALTNRFRYVYPLSLFLIGISIVLAYLSARFWS